MQGETILGWQTLEYPKVQRSNDWFWWVGTIGVGGAVASFIFGNILFAIFLLIATKCLFIFATKKPRNVTIEITEKGVRLENIFYPYDKIKAFYVTPENMRLHLITTKYVLPMITVDIEDHNPSDITEVLLNFLPEQKVEEGVTDKIIERLGL